VWLRYRSTSNIAKGDVLVINNAHTESGLYIGSDGNQTTGGKTGRWLFHSNRGQDRIKDYPYKKSDGCFIPSTEEMTKLLDVLKEWGIHDEINIPGRLQIVFAPRA